MGKKQIFEPNLRLVFFVLILFAALTVRFDYKYAIAEGLFILLLFLYYRSTNVKRRRELAKYVDQVTANVESAGHTNLMSCPLPMVIVRLDNYQVVWANEQFYTICRQKEHIFDTNIQHIVPNFSLKWILEGKSENQTTITLFGKKYQVFGNIVRSTKGASGLMATLYWIDVTDLEYYKQESSFNKTTVAIIMLDNYEECFSNLAETQKSAILAAVDEKVNRWIQPTSGILRKYDRDKYILVFEARYLDKFIEGKFSVLESVQEIVGSGGTKVTLSIGIGKDAGNLAESFSYAQLSIDMSLSRGGDQAVIKNKYNFEFYGGRSKEMEKRTKVKSRVMATTLKRLITDSSSVVIMGHKNSDADAMGAAIGLVCAVQKLGKTANIVYNENTNLAKIVVDKVRENEAYANVFCDGQQVLLNADRNTLLIVVDCNRPEIVESKEILQSIHKIAVIDHHRRSSTYIENAALNFHEPYASSTCELVCEILQYICDPKDVNRAEAEALLAGIVLDTKNFTMHTGVRTFEAAAFARSAGADTITIKRVFQVDLESAVKRYGIIHNAKMIRKNIAVSIMTESVDRVIAAQAADALLDIQDILASFVVFPAGGETVISARSMGEINVQLICEKLGGGGHQTIAGAQIVNIKPVQVGDMLEKAIIQYYEENPTTPKKL